MFFGIPQAKIKKKKCYTNKKVRNLFVFDKQLIFKTMYLLTKNKF